MPSHTFIMVHFVFAPHERKPLLASADRIRILNYTAGLIDKHQSKLYIGAVLRDHIHLLVRIHAKHSVAEMAQIIKSNTSRFINAEQLVAGKFAWGEGYGAFSVSLSQVEKVKEYIRKQPEHHDSHNFDGEYRALLDNHGFSDAEPVKSDADSLIGV